MPIKIRFGPGGAARAVHDDGAADLFKQLGFQPPRRASHVEPIREGRNAWQWLVDMSPLGEDYQFCLWPPFNTRELALTAEHNWLNQNWVSGTVI